MYLFVLHNRWITKKYFFYWGFYIILLMFSYFAHCLKISVLKKTLICLHFFVIVNFWNIGNFLLYSGLEIRNIVGDDRFSLLTVRHRSFVNSIESTTCRSALPVGNMCDQIVYKMHFKLFVCVAGQQKINAALHPAAVVWTHARPRTEICSRTTKCMGLAGAKLI